jgi:hypothetical protein
MFSASSASLSARSAGEPALPARAWHWRPADSADAGKAGIGFEP